MGNEALAARALRRCSNPAASDLSLKPSGSRTRQGCKENTLKCRRDQREATTMRSHSRCRGPALHSRAFCPARGRSESNGRVVRDVYVSHDAFVHERGVSAHVRTRPLPVAARVLPMAGRAFCRRARPRGPENEARHLSVHFSARPPFAQVRYLWAQADTDAAVRDPGTSASSSRNTDNYMLSTATRS